MLREALEIIHLLWQGGYQTTRAAPTPEDARVFDLPERLPLIAVAAGGARAARAGRRARRRALRHRAAPDLIEAYTGAGGTGPRYAEVPLAWAPDERTPRRRPRRAVPLRALGWKVMSELPNPVNFEARRPPPSGTTREEFACGPDLDRHVEVFAEFTRRRLRPPRAAQRRPGPRRLLRLLRELQTGFAARWVASRPWTAATFSTAVRSRVPASAAAGRPRGRRGGPAQGPARHGRRLQDRRDVR